MDDEPSSHYPNPNYQPLMAAPHVREIRLINKLHTDDDNTLHCELKSYKLHQSPPYRALSYTWKSPFDRSEADDAPTEVIMVDEEPMTIGKNLVLALKALRNWHGDHDEFIWADAICIDQQNYKERAYQVSIMGDIYGSAASIFVWLGEEAQDSDKALRFVKLLSNCRQDLEFGRVRTLALARDLRYKAHWIALGALWRRRWWTRGWVLQETVLARRADFCCGRMITSDADVFNHGRALHVVWDELTMILNQQYGLQLHVPTHHTLDGISRIRTARLHGNTMPILTCHYRTMSSQVTDHRDALFSRLGMASDGHIIQPSYTDSVPEVFTSFVLNYIRETKSLDIIHVDARPRVTDHIPSWVPDWTANYAAAPLQPEHKGNPRIDFHYYSACREEHAATFLETTGEEQKILNCKGYVFDVVDGVSRAEEQSWAGSAEPRPMSQPRSNRCAYLGKTAIFEGLWKAIVNNQEENGDTASPTTGLILADSFRAADARLAAAAAAGSSAASPIFDSHCSQIGGFELFGQTVSQRMAQAAVNSPTVAVPTSTRNDIEFSMVHSMIFKKMMTTNGGFFGVAPHETEPGDVIAILLGSSVPIILHPVDSGMHTVVGAVYVHGIMYGEAMEGLRKKYETPVVFRIA